jgi:hydrogenase nickel incorporation protein HypA/HybF
MHELAITEEIVSIVSAEAAGAKVTRVVVRVGKLSAVLPDAMRFCFDLCAAGTPAEGARLEIIETPGRGRCRACGAEAVLEGPFESCPCGSAELDWIEGDELRISEMEVA